MSDEPVWRFMDRRDIADVSGATDVYLRRWYLITTPFGGLMLHNIRRPDADRALHDHPWSFASLILRGGYIEERRADSGRPRRLHYHAGNLNLVRAESLHRIDSLSGSVWTLVAHGPRRRVWGFSPQPGQWIDWRRHLAVAS